MNVYEPILYACIYLGLTNEILELEKIKADSETCNHPLNNGNIEVQQLSEEQKTLFFMLQHACFAVEEMACDYLPLFHNQTIFSDGDCQILFSAFDKPIRGIKHVKHGGTKCTFNDYVTFLKVGCKNEPYEIEYAYYPAMPTSFVQEFETHPIVSARILAYKIASDYCLSKSLFDESVMWDKRYNESMNFLKNKLSEKRLKNFELY